MRIRFGLPRGERVTLEIYNVRGERVAALARDKTMPAGYHALVWDGDDRRGGPAASGVYLCRLRAGPTVMTRRLVLLR